MINFSIKQNSWKLRARDRVVDSSYLKSFNDALLNLELNLQEERIKTHFEIT